MWLDIRIHKEARNYQPYLNGKKLNNCFAAKESNWLYPFVKGWTDCYKTDENGKTLLNKEKTELQTIRLYGKVQLKKIK